MNVIERNNVHLQGRGDAPMVFAHGYGCDQMMWRLVEPVFRPRYQTLLFDHVGAGGSDISAYNRVKYATLHGYADDLLELCEELDLHDIIFVGHSVGATVGALAALEQPARFRHLVLVAPNPCFLREDGYNGGLEKGAIQDLLRSLESNFDAWARAMAPLIMGNPQRPELGQELAASFCRTKPDIAKHFAQVTFLADHRADFGALTLPTLILQSRNDLIAPPCVGQFLHENIKGSVLAELTAEGHCPHVSAASETIAAIETYLDRPQRRSLVSAPPAR